jgi:hypothetical protein
VDWIYMAHDEDKWLWFVNKARDLCSRNLLHSVVWTLWIPLCLKITKSTLRTVTKSNFIEIMLTNYMFRQSRGYRQVDIWNILGIILHNNNNNNNNNNNIVSYPDIYLSIATGPKPLPKPVLHTVRSRASSFKCELVGLLIGWIV